MTGGFQCTGCGSDTGLLNAVLTATLMATITTTQAPAEPILVDDFNDGIADGWTILDSTTEAPWGPGIFDVNGKGEYRLEGNGLVRNATPGDGFLGSFWDASSDLMYSDGFFRGRVRLGNSNKAGLGMRFSGTLETGLNGYLFRVTTAHAPTPRLLIDRIENTAKIEGPTFNFPVPVDEDLMLEAGAVGDQLSLKVWPASEAEPVEAQLLWTDATFPSGMLALEANTLGWFPLLPRVKATFDDLFFIPADEALAVEKSQTFVPEPSGLSSVMMAVACLGFVSRRRRGRTHCFRPMYSAIRTKAVQRALFLGCALTSKFVLSASASAQAVFDLGSFLVDTDWGTGNKTLSIPAGTYNSYRLTTDWSNVSGGAWSREAMWVLGDSPHGESATTYYSYEGEAPNSAANTSPVALVWDDFLDLPISGPLDISLIPIQYYQDSTGRWANTIIEFSLETPPPAPTLSADLGIVANPFSPLSIITSGDFDTELAIYSSTGALIRSNDDAPGNVSHSAINFNVGLPVGDYIAALGGFNTTFEDDYQIASGGAAGDYGITVGGSQFDGSLTSGQVAYVGFQIVRTSGDFNVDGDVDGSDFLKWQMGESPNPLSALDLADWQANYGAASSLASVRAVPEPNAAMLACGMVAALLVRRWRRSLILLPAVSTTALSVVSIALAMTALIGSASAQAFPNDNDGLLDVGEVPWFPANPTAATGELDLSGDGIEDLDGASLLTNLQKLGLRINDITSIESGDFTGLTNLQSLDLHLNHITSIESGDFNGLTNLQWLGLGANDITSIESGDFNGLTNLQLLHLSSNSLTSIEQGDFEGLTNLQSLNLSSNSLTSVEQGDFEGLTNLQSLNLSSNSLTSIESGGFNGLTNLQSLNLRSNDITSIEHGDFGGLTNLQWLGLENNNITSVESGGFNGLTNLQSLNLSRNSLTSIESGDFNGLTNLQSLDLEHNNITSVESGGFNGLTNLQSLNLSRNSLTSIEQGDFEGLTNLQLLHLSSNSLTSIEQGDFEGLTNLQSLELAHNDLTSIEPGDFSGLPNLKSLNLGSNSLTSIEPGDFSGLTNLQTLDLRRNSLTSIEQGDFEGLTNLQSLKLGSKLLTSIKPGAFHELANLKTLRVAFNDHITSLEPGIFSGLPNLQSLSLSGELMRIESGDFNGLTNLQSLSVERNDITSIEQGDFHGLTNLQSLNLRSNDFTSIEPGDFEGLTNLQSLSLEHNDITSIESGGFDGLTNLQSLNLERNDVTSIEQGAFSGLTNLQTLDLAANSLTNTAPGLFDGLRNLVTLGLEGNDLTYLDFTAATFDQLSAPFDFFLGFPLQGFLVDSHKITTLILDDAELSQSAFDVIVTETDSIREVSLVGLTFSNAYPSDLSKLLGISTLDHVSVDQSLFGMYADEFNDFAAISGNTVTVVPEPGTTALTLLALSNPLLLARRRQSCK